MKIHFFATGDAFGNSGRFQTRFHVVDGDDELLIDCGATSVARQDESNFERAHHGLVLSL